MGHTGYWIASDFSMSLGGTSFGKNESAFVLLVSISEEKVLQDDPEEDLSGLAFRGMI